MRTYKFKELEVGVHYVAITNGSTVYKGEHVYLESDGCLVNEDSGGWLVPPIKIRNLFAVDCDYYDDLIVLAVKQIKDYESIIKRLS